MPEELIAINVWLSGRSYRLRIKPEEEATVRKSVKLADEKIKELKTHYAGKDDQDFIAMCLLTYAADSATEAFNNPLLHKELETMNEKIDNLLSKTD